MKNTPEGGTSPQINKMAETLRVDAEVFIPKRQVCVTDSTESGPVGRQSQGKDAF